MALRIPQTKMTTIRQQRRAEPYLRSTSSSTTTTTTNSIGTKNESIIHRNADIGAIENSSSLSPPVISSSNVSSPSIPPPPPPPPLSSLTNIKSPSYRITVDDLHQSPLLQNLSLTNGEYRSSTSSNYIKKDNSTISKLIENRRESDINSTNKEQQQTAPRIREISSNVGFVSLPDQVHRRAIKKGFEFNLMVVGQSGLGKSTFINTLFQTELYGQDFPSTIHRKKKSVTIDSSSIILKEKGVQLRLTIVDTPGFGDSVDNSNCWQPIIDYIDSKYEEYLNGESRVIRKTHIIDNRIHACLYFISPTGHSLQSLDIEFMKRLHDRVNIIPVIGKSDTLTSDELRLFKKSIMQDITNEKIKLYEYPDYNSDHDYKLNKIYKDKVPFAVVGSNFVLERGNKRTRIRQYAWGTVDVEDEAHSDFIALRSMIIKTNLNDLRDVTHNVHYENYRYKKLTSFHGNELKNGKTLQTSSINKNLLSQIEDERIEVEERLNKMSRDMENVYQSKVEEKYEKLQENKQNLLKSEETFRLNIQQEEENIQRKRLDFENIRRQWEDNLNKSSFNDQYISLTKPPKKGLF
ncbi:unnamed protein product [Rotaria sordida]|uniref:Septin-type G domain-containing protein n=1 Tax=Rotaria sordida TaxID=392033 RepID=A0A814Q0H0_9BILA|nr:unnamed protein product [Rotaria sordida]CAF1273182.1 unnamed protein product [Rotaria sordida]CAF1325972.1 unnamed protein product [Rotaria sordida]CAF1351896.1 unnamed protein product [Rotaria sordida]CAF3970900.1 unnamed protein product [Rotaria sordida]